MNLLGIIGVALGEDILEGVKEGSLFVGDEYIFVFDLGDELVEDGEVVQIVGR